MAINNFHFKLDIEREDHIPKFRLKQYDTAIFYASLYKNGLPYHFEGEKIKMFVKKSDGTIVYQEDNITIQDDEVKINVKNQALTASGLTYAELELKSSTGQVTTATFLFEVKEKVGSDKAIESITDICTLEKLDRYVGQAKKELDKFKQDLSKLEDLVANKDKLEGQNTEAKVNIKGLERVLEQASNIVDNGGKKVTGNNVISESSNGYIQNLKLTGNSLVNLIKIKDPFTGSGITAYTHIVALKNLEVNKTYTYIPLNVPSFIKGMYLGNSTSTENIIKYTADIKPTTFTVTHPIELDTIMPHFYGANNTNLTTEQRNELTQKVKLMILEGDYTKNPPSYFEGLKSVGDGIDEIEILSNNLGNMLDKSKIIKGGYLNKNNGNIQQNTNSFYTDYFIEINSSFKNLEIRNNQVAIFTYYDNNKNFISGEESTSIQYSSIPKNAKYMKFSFYNRLNIIDSLYVGFSKDNSKINIKYKQDKTSILFRNNNNWSKPILRKWDTIEKYLDGNYYYRKKCMELTINGSENWVFDGDLGNTIRCYLRNSNLSPGLVISDRFNSIQNYVLDEEHIYASEGLLWVFLNKSKATDLNTFKNYFKGTPTTVVCPMIKEEIYECLDISTRSFNPQTLLSVNSGVIDPGVEYSIPSSFVSSDSSISEKLENIDLNNFDLNLIKLPGLNLKDSLDAKYLNINKGDIFNFNETIEPGRYSVGAETTLPGAPFPNSIYGSLIVLPRRGNERQQIFLTIDGYISSRFLNYQGNWSDWSRIPKLSDFEGENSQTNGYQKFPNGTIIQWGSTVIKFDGYRAKGYLYYPIAFKEYVHCTGNVASNSYGGYCETTGSVAGDNLTRGYAEALDFESKNENGKDVRIQWIAIGR